MLDSLFDLLTLAIAIVAFIVALKAMNQVAALRARLDAIGTTAAPARHGGGVQMTGWPDRIHVRFHATLSRTNSRARPVRAARYSKAACSPTPGKPASAAARARSRSGCGGRIQADSMNSACGGKALTLPPPLFAGEGRSEALSPQIRKDVSAPRQPLTRRFARTSPRTRRGD